MRAKAGIFIFICLLFLIGTVGADPLTITNSSSNTWISVSDPDNPAVITSTVITVNVKDTAGANVENATVSFGVENLLGTFPAGDIKTNAAGNAAKTFTADKQSGVAKINVTVIYLDAVNTTTKIFDQNINHGQAYYDLSSPLPLFIYPEEGNVATEIPFTVSVHDRWGNPLDNRTGDHFVTLHMHSSTAPDDCGFNIGGVFPHDLSLPLNADGNLTVNARLSSKIGTNSIIMDRFDAIRFPPLVTINVVSGGIPYSISGTISDGGQLVANNIDKFTLDYHLYDASRESDGK